MTGPAIGAAGVPGLAGAASAAGALRGFVIVWPEVAMLIAWRPPVWLTAVEATASAGTATGCVFWAIELAAVSAARCIGSVDCEMSVTRPTFCAARLGADAISTATVPAEAPGTVPEATVASPGRRAVLPEAVAA